MESYFTIGHSFLESCVAVLRTLEAKVQMYEGLDRLAIITQEVLHMGAWTRPGYYYFLLFPTMSTKEGHKKLSKATESFLSDVNFGHVAIEDMMVDVFGDYTHQEQTEDATCWAAYWKDLILYDEVEHEGKEAVMPKVCEKAI